MEYGALMEMAVRAGEIMLASGAEVYRVEDTIHRILKHSGIARADVFVVTTGIVATIADASLPPLTLVKRVENRATNLNRIYQVNNVSREFCSGKLSVREAQERLDRIANTTLYGFWKKCIGYAATTGFFAVMFGGGPGECLVAAVVGVVLAFVLRAASNLMLNDFCQNALGSFALAVAAYLLRRGAFLGMSLDVVIISAIMPLVPGVTFTAAIRDTLNGDYSSGVARMAEAVVVALAVASVWRSWQSGWREDRYDRDDKRIDDPERGSISGDFWFFPAGRYAAEISGLCGHYRRCRMAGVPGIDAGGNLAGGGGIFFQSGSGSAESGICTRVKSARHDLSGGRNPADGAGRIDLPERLFSDTGTDKMVQFLSDPDDPDSGGDGGCHLYCGFTVPSAPE